MANSLHGNPVKYVRYKKKLDLSGGLMGGSAPEGREEVRRRFVKYVW